MPSPPARLRVLVADDSPPVRERMISLLRELPCVTLTAEAADVPGTIDGICRLQPHVVILDLGMPGGCGLDVLDFIRAKLISTQVVVLTNDTDPEYKARALQAGAVAFLDKSRDFLKAIDFVLNLATDTRCEAPDSPSQSDCDVTFSEPCPFEKPPALEG